MSVGRALRILPIESLYFTKGASLAGLDGEESACNFPCVQVQSLGQEDPLDKGLTTHSNNLAWRNPWTEEPGRLQSMGLQKVGHY